MIYRELGTTGIQVSALGFGAMRLPMVSIGGHEYVDIDKAVEVIRHAFDLGVNYIDSGFMYCEAESETAVGRALKGWRDKITLSTKATKMRMSDPGDLRRMIEHQLVRLEVDSIDLYCFHGIGWEGLHEIDGKTGWIADLQRAKDEGLLSRIAFSFHDKPENMAKLVDMGMFEAVTCQYNYLDTKNAEPMAYAKERGLGVIVMGPVGGGRLAGLPGFLRDVDEIDTSSAAGLALRYVLANPSVDVVLSGMGSVEMVDQNAAAIEAGPIGPDQREQLDALYERTKGLADLYCTGCGYCVSCPQGVKIPQRFEAMNYLKVYGLADHARTVYTRTRKAEAKADGQGECTECGECEEKCPQQIPIVEQLRETGAALGEQVAQS